MKIHRSSITSDELPDKLVVSVGVIVQTSIVKPASDIS